MKNIVLFASGNGTNVQRITEYFKGNPGVVVKRIYCNKKDAFVLTRAEKLKIPTMVFNRQDFYDSNRIVNGYLYFSPS